MDTIIPQKYCLKCQENLPATTEYFHINSHTVDNLHTYCKKCRQVRKENPQKGGRPRKKEWSCIMCGETDLTKVAAGYKGYRASYCKKCESKRSTLQKHGLSEQELQAMFESQFGLCAICGKAPKSDKWCIDHCHTSGVIRALLCYPCNHILGMAQDNPEILMKAIKYLELHSS